MNNTIFPTIESAIDEITALRAAHEALLRRTQSLETALDQERADNEKARAEIGALRAFAQHTGAWCGQNMGHACTCGLDALLSGRGDTGYAGSTQRSWEGGDDA